MFDRGQIRLEDDVMVKKSLQVSNFNGIRAHTNFSGRNCRLRTRLPISICSSCVGAGSVASCTSRQASAVLICGVKKRLGLVQIGHGLDCDFKISGSEVTDPAHVTGETGFDRHRVGIDPDVGEQLADLVA